MADRKSLLTPEQQANADMLRTAKARIKEIVRLTSAVATIALIEEAERTGKVTTDREIVAALERAASTIVY
jgi:hypothetical protein